jgi:hypothetical protein
MANFTIMTNGIVGTISNITFKTFMHFTFFTFKDFSKKNTETIHIMKMGIIVTVIAIFTIATFHIAFPAFI